MSRTAIPDQEIRRTLEGLLSCCDLLERLAPFVQRLLRREDAENLGTVRVALARLDAVRTVLATAVEAAPTSGLGEAPEAIAARCARAVLEGTVRPGETPAPRGPCVLRGQSPQTPIAAVLELLHAHGKSGVVQIVTPRETFTLELDAGCISHAVSDTPPADQRLGAILVRRGVLRPAELQRALLEMPDQSGTMGEALRRHQLVSEAALRSALEEQVQSLFHRLFTSTEATFHFFEGEPQRPEVQIRLNVIQLLIESARNVDEGGR